MRWKQLHRHFTSFHPLRLAYQQPSTGAIPEIKFPTAIKRLQEARVFPANIFFRTSTARRNEDSFLQANRIIPPLAYGTCVNTLCELGVPCSWADGEGDQKCFEVAASLGALVLSNDTDFAILASDGYAGFAHMNEILWEVKLDSSNELANLDVEADDGWTPAVKPKSKGRNTLRPKTGDGRTSIRGTILPPSDSTVLSMTLTVYRPQALATHFRIPTPFLPLFASLCGNDFTPDSHHSRFFFRGLTSSQRIERVVEVLRPILSGPPKGQAKASEKPDVPTMIKTAVKALCLREPTPAEVDEMADAIIDSILQYGAQSSRNGPFGSRPQSSTHRCQDDVNAKYSEAYQAGEFSPKILDIVATSTRWSNLFLENPDVQTCHRTTGLELLTWICAVLNDGIPIGIMGEDEQDGMTDKAKSDSEDEDELISVIEELSDSSDEDNGRGRQRNGRGMWPEEEESEAEDEDDEEDDPYYESYTDGVPPSLLTSALRRLRHQRYLQGDLSAAQTPTSAGSPQSATSPAVRSPRSGLKQSTTAVTGSTRSAHITAYLRSGQRVVPFRVEVQNLHSLLASASRGKSSQHGGVQSSSLWKGPVQLQPTQTRLGVFLCALRGNTNAVRSLVNEDPAEGEDAKLASWAVLVLALRWVVMRMADKGKSGDESKWTKGEAKAFLRSCIETSRLDTAPGESTEGSTASASPSNLFSPSEFPSLPNSTNLEATPRAIQLTAHLLVAIESAQHLAQVLLLTDTLELSGIEKRFSGRRFHESLRDGAKSASSSERDRKLFEILWRAVEEDAKAEWWADERGNSDKQKAPVRPPPPTRKPTGKVQPGRLWSTLASLKD